MIKEIPWVENTAESLGLTTDEIWKHAKAFTVVTIPCSFRYGIQGYNNVDEAPYVP